MASLGTWAAVVRDGFDRPSGDVGEARTHHRHLSALQGGRRSSANWGYRATLASGVLPDRYGPQRSLKRCINEVVYAAPVAHPRQRPQAGPGGQTGNVSASSAAGSHPATPTLRKSHSQTRTKPAPH